MKVKIKGLVFVGFAAAVFAQSAMATPSEPARRVASKEYVDTYAQEQAKRVTTTNISTIATGLSQTDPWEHDDMYPSMKVLKGVKDTLTAIDVTGDDYVNVTEGTGANEGKFTVALDTNDLAATADAITDTTAASTGHPGGQSKLVTAGAVNAYAEATANKKTTITGNETSTTSFPTTGAVYDYAQPRVTSTMSGVYVGTWDSNGSTASWNQLSTSGYVAADTTSGYAIGLDGSKIADNASGRTIAAYGTAHSAVVAAGANATEQQQSDEADAAERLTTAKAVYDFVTSYGDGAYQPHVTGTGAKVGTLNTTGGVDSYDWETIQASGGQTSNAASTSYLTMTHSGTTYEVNLTSDQIASAGSTIAGADLTANSNDVDNVKLATALAVKDYMNGFGLGDASATLPSECRTSGSNGVCSLIAYYDDSANKIIYKWELTVPEPVATTPVQGD